MKSAAWWAVISVRGSEKVGNKNWIDLVNYTITYAGLNLRVSSVKSICYGGKKDCSAINNIC